MLRRFILGVTVNEMIAKSKVWLVGREREREGERSKDNKSKDQAPVISLHNHAGSLLGQVLDSLLVSLGHSWSQG